MREREREGERGEIKREYIKYIGFGLVGFYGILTVVDYLMSYTLYTYILNIYEFVWLGFMVFQPS